MTTYVIRVVGTIDMDTVKEVDEQIIDLFSEPVNVFPEDQLIIDIFSPGGDLASFVYIYNKLNDLPFKIKARVLGEASSAAGILALSFDDLEIMPYSYMMFHETSFSISDTSQQNINMFLNVLKPIYVDKVDNLCSPFLTPKEIVDIKQGKEIYITYNDFDLDNRIKRHFKHE